MSGGGWQHRRAIGHFYFLRKSSGSQWDLQGASSWRAADGGAELVWGQSKAEGSAGPVCQTLR